MSVPTTLVIRTFTDHAEALAHSIQRAGDAPRILAYDDTVGCPVEQALAALEWTRVVGLLPDDDLLHAGRLTSETAAAVVERKISDGRRWVFLGPRLDAAPVDPFEGEHILDEPGVVGIAFGDRAMALAHFLRATGGGGALLAQARPTCTGAAPHASLARADRAGTGRTAPAHCRLVRRLVGRRTVPIGDDAGETTHIVT